MGEPEAPSPKKKRGSKAAMVGIAFGVLMLAAPAVGLLLTVFGLNQAFSAVGDDAVPADQKANQLSEGISMAMNATMYGLALHVAGWVVLVVAVIWYAKTAKTANQSTPSPG